MKFKSVFSLVLICGVVTGAVAAPVARGRTSVGGGTGVAKNTSVSKNTSVRAAIGSRSGGVKNTTASASKVTSARAAVKKTTSAPKAPTVAARAGTTQKVIGTGTKVQGATQNTAVDKECQDLYNGCMDMFCVIENASGGRCVCSDKYKTFDKIVKEIEQLNAESYKLAGLGTETIKAVVEGSEVVSLESLATEDKIEIKEVLSGNEVGSVLKKTAHDTCVERIPQCADKISILSAMYTGQINGDCVAYDNALKQKRADAKNKMRAAEGNVREIALESVKNANKYDLGQCTIKFRECMQTTAGCGDDFSKCASVSAMDATNTRQSTSKKSKNYQVKGAKSNIEISASTYDTLVAKKPICESVTKQCTNVADKVWDTFLKDIAPQLKTAELIAENNARQNCIGNISDCFQKACKDNIDPNDPDGSYDMCLSRPESMLNVCKVPLDACGVDSSNAQNARKSKIWDYVLAKLAAMKVDACTTEVKECLTDEDRCGADFSQCVGLSTEQIIRMCPYDKLTGCQSVHDKDLTSNEVYANLNNVVQGIILNVDNKMLTTCQAAVDAAAIRVCGEDLECGTLVNLDTIGTTSLDYKICEYMAFSDGVIFTNHCYDDPSLISDEDLGRVKYSKTGELGPVTPYAAIVDVPIYWESISVGLDGKYVGLDDYVSKLQERKEVLTDEQISRLETEINGLKNSLNTVVSAIESDPTVSACMNGRKINGYDFKKVARFPNITQSTRALIATKLLNRAKKNYYAKYDTYNERQLKDYLKIAERQAQIKGENFKDKQREIARQSCVSMAEMSVLPKSTEPPSGVLGGILLGIIAAVAIATVCVLTAGGGAVALGAASVIAEFFSTSFAAGMASVAASVPALAAAGISGVVLGTVGVAGSIAVTAAGIAEAKNNKDTYDMAQVQDYNGQRSVEYWNYKEDVTTIFNPTDLSCEKCVVARHCSKTKAPMFGDQYCETWGEPIRECTTIEF